MSHLDRQSGSRFSIRAVPSTMRVAAVALIAACGSSHGDRPANGSSTVTPLQTPDHVKNLLESEVLAVYAGEWDGPHNTFRLVRMSPGEPGQISQNLVLGSLAGVTNGPTGGTTPSVNTVLLHQTATRSLGSACNSAPYGDSGVPGGFTGICVPIQAISGYASSEILRLHVELTILQYNGPTMGGTVTTYVKTPSDSDFSTSNTRGLWNYGRLAQSGTTSGGGAQLDRASRNWYFQTTDSGSTAAFNFRLVIKGEVVSPIKLVGTSCIADSTQRPSVSSDGRYVTYATTSGSCTAGGGARQIYRYDTQTSTNTLVSHADGAPATGAGGNNSAPSMSSNGQWVAWLSTGTNLIPGGGDTCGNTDSNAGLADVYVSDMSTGTIYIASGGNTTFSARPSVEPNGNYVVFDTTGAIDIFGADINTVSDVYRYGMPCGIIEALSPVIDADGNPLTRTAAVTVGAMANDSIMVVFQSTETFGLGSDTNSATDVFVQDLVNFPVGSVAGTRRISSTTGGSAGNAASLNGAISADGSVVAFQSTATNMIGTTTASRSHIYVRTTDATLSGLARADSPSSGEASNNGTLPSLSESGRMVMFNSQATNLDSLDTTSSHDAYMYDRTTTDTARQVPFVVSISRSNAIASSGISSIGTAIGGTANYGVFISSANNLTSPSGSGNSLYVAPLR